VIPSKMTGLRSAELAHGAEHTSPRNLQSPASRAHVTAKVNPQALYKIGVLWVFPFFVALHGFVWVSYGISFAPAVYAMKLALFPFFFLTLLKFWKQIVSGRDFIFWLPLIGLCAVGSLISPFVTGKGITGYYFSDFVGFSVAVGSVFACYTLFKLGKLDLSFIEKVSVQYLILISVYIVGYFFLSGGMKISITPEMQIPMAIAFGAFFFKRENGYVPGIWVFPVIFVGCYFSLLRENLIVFGLLLAICLARRIAGSVMSWRVIGFAGSALLAVVVVLLFSQIVSSFQELTVRGANQVLDDSLLQRFVEVEMVWSEMERAPLSWWIGQGFGAEYANYSGELIFYDRYVHNIHSSPMMVYFRNGALGIVLYMFVFMSGVVCLFSRSMFVFRSALCVTVFFATLFFNQYLYWNVQFGLIVGLLLFSLRCRAG
jgi:hypothetical protein